MGPVIVEHKEERRAGMQYLFRTVVFCVFFAVFWNRLPELKAGWLIPVIGAAMLLCTALMFIRSKNQEILDSEGVTAKTLFGAKNYLWADACSFRVKWTWSQKKGFSAGKEKIPYIVLVFSDPKKEFRFPYREDILGCIRQNYGAPDVDTWSEENQ